MVKKLELLMEVQDERESPVLIKPGQIRGDHLVALGNPPQDDNRFSSTVAGVGASAAIASDPSRAMYSPSDFAPLQAQDTLTLHKLAPSYRQLMPQRPISSPVPASSRTISTKGIEISK